MSAHNIVKNLNTNKFVLSKLKKRSKRIVRAKTRTLIEEHIKSYLRNDYYKIGSPLYGPCVQRFQMQLNRACYKSERVFVENLIKNGVSNFFPNMILLNRFFGDVVFPFEGLVVELDGSSHRDNQDKDLRKDYWLNVFGYQVIRVDATRENNLIKAASYISRIVVEKEINKLSTKRAEILPPIFLKKGEFNESKRMELGRRA